MNQKSIIAVLGVLVVFLIGSTAYFATTNKITQPVAPAPKVVQQPMPTPAPAVQQTITQTIDESKWNEYAGIGFSFEYPMQNCDLKDTSDCEKTIVVQNDDKIDIGLVRNYNNNTFVLPISTLYFTNVQDEKGVNKYLQETFNNNCKISSVEPIKGSKIKSVSLSEGCTLWGPDGIKFKEGNPQARGLVALRNSAFFNEETGTFVLYPTGAGAGCAFNDCSAEDKILQSIKLGDTKVSDLLK